VGKQWFHELKLDGYRIQAHIDKGGKVRLYTRSGLDWTHRMLPLRARWGGFPSKAQFWMESRGAFRVRAKQLCRPAGGI